MHDGTLPIPQVITWGQSFPANDTKYKKWFHESAEDQYGSMAQVRQRERGIKARQLNRLPRTLICRTSA